MREENRSYLQQNERAELQEATTTREGEQCPGIMISERVHVSVYMQLSELVIPLKHVPVRCTPAEQHTAPGDSQRAVEVHP